MVFETEIYLIQLHKYLPSNYIVLKKQVKLDMNLKDGPLFAFYFKAIEFPSDFSFFIGEPSGKCPKGALC